MGQCHGFEFISLSLGFKPLLPWKTGCLRQVVISDKTQHSHFSFLTLIITMWDSSRISRKWGFSTDKLMLGTGGTHKRIYYMLVRAPTRTWQCKDGIYYTFGIEMIFDVPLRAWSVLHIGTAGHLHLFPAPEQKQNMHFLTVWRKNKTKKQSEKKFGWFLIRAERRAVLPLWESFARGVKHAAGSSVQEADFATQHLHEVTPPTPTHLHHPQVIGVTCAILRTGKQSKSNITATQQKVIFSTYSQCRSP